MDRKWMTCSFSLQIGGFEGVSLVSNSGEAFLFVLCDQKRGKHSGGKMSTVYNMNSWIFQHNPYS